MSQSSFNMGRYLPAVERCNPIRLHGKVIQVVGLVIEGYLPGNIGGRDLRNSSQGW